MAEDMDFLSEMTGFGCDAITANEQVIPYLGLVQPDSDAAASGATPGVWRNSATGEEYGSVVTVVPLVFKVIWNERESTSPFATVGRYLPHSIQVTIQQTKNGKGYPKMINPDTGNEVQELYMYGVILPEHPEAGVLLFNPTVSSMKACKQWNTQLKNQLLSNGTPAPIFAFSWNLAVALVDNPQKKGAKMAKFMKAERNAAITKSLFDDYVKPMLPTIQQTLLSITSDVDNEDAE